MGSDDIRTFWDEQAAAFDDEPDHGLRDPITRQAWEALIDDVVGERRDAVVDLGCGTGSISTLLAKRGHRVLGVDLSTSMIREAEHKAQRAGLDVEFVVGDVQTAPVPTTDYGIVFSRHVLWAVPDAEVVIARWSASLTADGMFVAVEGVWNGAGIAPADAFSLLQSRFEKVEYVDLSGQTALWGKPVTDIRYVVVASHPRPSSIESVS